MLLFLPVFHLLLIFLTNPALERIKESHGLLITFIGLIAVFLGLLVLWTITTSMRILIEKLDSRKQASELRLSPETASGEIPERLEENEIIAAITVALHLELEEEPSKLTLRHMEQDMSPWVVASRPATMRHT